jgi:soluble lytic murein transglycosylase-like protein
MSIDVWTFRIPVRHHLCSLAIAIMVVALPASMAAQSLQAVSENGHIVWTNDGPPVRSAATMHSTTAAHSEAASHSEASAHSVTPRKLPSTFVYWSNTEQRWKPVRPATPKAMRSARAIAGEVSSYIESRPALDSSSARSIARVKGELAQQDPNYSAAAGNRRVSAAEIDRYINEAAARHHVDPNLVRALVKVESNFNPRAVSNKGAMGLMQLMPATAKMYDLRNPFDAAQNVDAGVRHLKGLLENFGGDVRLSLAAYNAGQGAVERNGGIPPYTETRNYVKRITNLMGGSSEVRLSSLSIPIHVSRNERGTLVISNTD